MYRLHEGARGRERLISSNNIEEVFATNLAALEHQFKIVQVRVGVGAAERRSGLKARDPCEGIEAKLLDRVRRGIATAEQNAADRRFGGQAAGEYFA